MFTLPDLGYDFDALEPYIDAKTMELHHDKHHATYATKLNEALEKAQEWQDKPIDELLANIDKLPEGVQQAVRNHGGGHYNHSLFWEILKPGGAKAPSGELAKSIDATFGSFEEFKKAFSDTAGGFFGSGWMWLVRDGDKLDMYPTANQYNPVMEGESKLPILGLDIWEHAYYLKYQNRRPEYIENFWRVVNWDVVAKLNT